MPWLSRRPPGCEQPRELACVEVELRLADVLDHADACNRVVGLAADLAVVGDADLDAFGEPRFLDMLASAHRLRLRERDADDVHPVRACGVDGERAPAATNVEHGLAGLEAELGADELELRLLRLFEGLGAAREDRAAVGEARSEEQLEELVADVVVVAHRACVALGAVVLALEHVLGRRAGAAAARSRRGAPRVRGAPSALRAHRRRLPGVEHPHDALEVVDGEVAGHIGAADAELAGRAQRVGERARRAHAEMRAAVAVGRRKRRLRPRTRR